MGFNISMSTIVYNVDGFREYFLKSTKIQGKTDFCHSALQTKQNILQEECSNTK